MGPILFVGTCCTDYRLSKGIIRFFDTLAERLSMSSAVTVYKLMVKNSVEIKKVKVTSKFLFSVLLLQSTREKMQKRPLELFRSRFCIKSSNCVFGVQA